MADLGQGLSLPYVELWR